MTSKRSWVIFLILMVSSLAVRGQRIHEVHEMHKFWTNVGLCPAGGINHNEISLSLNSEAMAMNLLYISSLPTGAVTSVRIHWLLELLRFVQFTQSGLPIYDFTEMDKFMNQLEDLNLRPVVEFMGNPGSIFQKNPLQNNVYWQDLVEQLLKHYLNHFGAAKVMQWKFETCNEPDLLQYNFLNFTLREYVDYASAVKRGLLEAGKRSDKSLEFQLRGPAGLFKSEEHHSLCWGILEYCSYNLKECPFDVLTFHQKGRGLSKDVVIGSVELLSKIYKLHPNLRTLPISNDEADPISGWSTARAENTDVRYANALVRIVMDHWDAKLHRRNFKNFESLSHDNAFLSFHPYEFQQRTLLAHFQMNNSQPSYSQFIKKPVYAALGLLARLGPMSQSTFRLNTSLPYEVRRWQTFGHHLDSLFAHTLDISSEHLSDYPANYTLTWQLPYNYYQLVDDGLSYIVEILDNQLTNPYRIWRQHGKPPYPNQTLRHLMRLAEVPKILAMGSMQTSVLTLDFEQLYAPWILSLRVCSMQKPLLKTPQNVQAKEVTEGEVYLWWQETVNSTDCLKSYEVWYRDEGQSWTQIAKDAHIPFPAYHFAPANGQVSGFYKIRGIDIFDRSGPFSEILEYYAL